MITILETLENAEYNIQQGLRLDIKHFIEAGQEQLHTGITLLQKGYGLYENMVKIQEEYKLVEEVPEKKEVQNVSGI